MSYLEGSHHILGEYWSDPSGCTIRAISEPHGTLYRLATDEEKAELCAHIPDSRLESGDLYCPGCPACDPGHEVQGEERP